MTTRVIYLSMESAYPTTSTLSTMNSYTEKNTFHLESSPIPRKSFARPSQIANPGPLGFFSCASTTFMLSMYNIGTRGITHPNVVVGMAIFCGGLAQLLAGMWEFPKGNVFGATAFTSYGVFWLSYASILLPGTGIVAAYTSPAELTSAIGIYLLTWTLVTSYFCIISFGKSVSFIVLFFFLTMTFAVLTAGALNDSVAANRAGGVLGVMTAFVAYYIGVAGILEAEPHPPFTLPLGELRH